MLKCRLLVDRCVTSALLVGILEFVPLGLISQIKADYHWILGAGVKDSINKYGLIDFEFLNDKMNVTSYYDNSTGIDIIESNYTVSRNNGRLLFFTQGCRVFDENFNIALNGDSINYPGLVYNSECGTGFSYRTHQGLIILPRNNNDSIFDLFSLRFDYKFNDNFYFPSSLTLSEIDASDSSKVIVRSKNKLLVQDTFFDQLTAVRHGNGRDWWIFVPKVNSSKIYSFLVSPLQIDGPYIQELGFFMTGNVLEYQLGKAVFSPNGSWYARVDNRNDVQMACFDRCSGEFSCTRPLKINDPKRQVLTVAFSENSQFLYVVTGDKVFQYETESVDLKASEVLVGEFDGFSEPHEPSALMYQPQLAPDGRIYMSSLNGTYWMHVINRPNEKGVSCEFICRGIKLPVRIGFCLPNYPYYNLYDWAGSICDTLGIDNSNPSGNSMWKLRNTLMAPNPANEFVDISAPECDYYSVHVFDIYGKEVHNEVNLNPFQGMQINTSNWVSGLYFVVFNFNSEKIETQKLMVTH